MLPPTNVSVTATENQEYELSWKKHTFKYDFIKQRYEVEYWKSDEDTQVSLRMRGSPGFLFAGQMGKTVPLTRVICASFFSLASPQVKYQQ